MNTIFFGELSFILSRTFTARPNVKVAPPPPAMRTILSNSMGSGNVPYGPSTEAFNAAPGLATAYLWRSLVNPFRALTVNSTGELR
jgi:hypothetical protein